MPTPTVTVDATALRSLLVALTGPAHLIRELQATVGLPALGHPNPIKTVLDQFNTRAAKGWDQPEEPEAKPLDRDAVAYFIEVQFGEAGRACFEEQFPA